MNQNNGNSKRHILVVEDEEPLRKVLVDILNQNGFLTLEANNGTEALEIGLREHPDLILLDILMPGIDGITMLKKLRQDVWGTGVPVIILTNFDPDARALEAVRHERASYYLVKSQTSMEGLVIKVQEVLKHNPRS